MTSRAVVTDHALVRYLERVYGLPVEEVREEIADLIHAKAPSLPEREAHRLVQVGGHLYQLRGGHVVTVLYDGAPKRARRRIPGELKPGDPREPGSRPATDGDPWWWAMSAGWTCGSD